MPEQETESTANFRGSSAGRLERSWHWQVLVLSVAIILLSFQLKILPAGRVALRILPDHPLPETCFSKVWFSTECPGCGLTRSFICLAQGRWADSFQLNRLGWILAIGILLQIPYRIAALSTRRRLVSSRVIHWLGGLLMAALILNWLISQWPVARNQPVPSQQQNR